MVSVWLGRGAGVSTFIPVPHLRSVFVPLPLFCLSVVPAECRDEARCGATCYGSVTWFGVVFGPACWWPLFSRWCVSRGLWFPLHNIPRTTTSTRLLSYLVYFPCRERVQCVGVGGVWRAAVGGHTSPPLFSLILFTVVFFCFPLPIYFCCLSYRCSAFSSWGERGLLVLVMHGSIKYLIIIPCVFPL